MNRRELLAVLIPFLRGGLAALEAEASAPANDTVSDFAAHKAKRAKADIADAARIRIAQLYKHVGTATGRG